MTEGDGAMPLASLDLILDSTVNHPGTGLYGSGGLSLKYQVSQGRQLSLGSFENQEEVHLGQDGSLTLFRRRCPGGMSLPAPGRYTGRMSPDEMASLLDAISVSPLNQPSRAGSSPNDSVHRLQIVFSGRPHAFSCGTFTPEERMLRRTGVDGMPMNSLPPIHMLSPETQAEFRMTFDVPDPAYQLRIKFAYRQWVVPGYFAGLPLFQGEVFSEECLI